MAGRVKDYQLEDAFAVWEVDKYLKANEIEYSTAGDERVLFCPRCEELGHNGKDKLWFNAEKRIGWCYRCEKVFDPVGLLCAFEGVEQNDAKRRVVDQVNIIHSEALNDLFRGFEEDAAAVWELPFYEVPDEFDLPQEAQPITAKSPAFAYLADRRLSKKHVDAYNLHYVPERSRSKFSGRIIIPVYVREVLATFVARDFTGKSKLRYLYPKNNPTGKVIFNYDVAKKHIEQIVICEGAIDAMTIGPHAVALLGKSLSRQQDLLIAESHDDHEYVIFFDGDKAGVDASMKVGTALARHGYPVKIAICPEEEDANSLGRRKANELINNAIQIHELDT